MQRQRKTEIDVEEDSSAYNKEVEEMFQGPLETAPTHRNGGALETSRTPFIQYLPGG